MGLEVGESVPVMTASASCGDFVGIVLFGSHTSRLTCTRLTGIPLLIGMPRSEESAVLHGFMKVPLQLHPLSEQPHTVLGTHSSVSKVHPMYMKLYSQCRPSSDSVHTLPEM